MSRTRRQPAPAPAVVPCTPATWLPPGAVVSGELQGGAARLVVVLVDGEELASPLAAIQRVSWEHLWLSLVATAWSRHRLRLAHEAALERDAASTPAEVRILRREGER